MKTIRPGYCVRLGADLNELIRHTSIVQSNGEVFTDNLKDAWDFKQKFPHIDIACRWTDEEKLIPEKISPAKFLQDRLKNFDELGIPHDAIVIHTSNEPDPTPMIAAWEAQYAREVLAIQGVRPRSLLINIGVGRIDDHNVHIFGDVLEICVQHPDLFYVGNHGYAPVVWSVGINGTAAPGYNTIKRGAGQPLAEEAKLQPEEWPTKVTRHCWFMGGWRWFAQYCHDQFKAMPAIWESECGFDDIKNVEWWQQALPRPLESDGKTKMRLAGWQTLPMAWRQIFKSDLTDEEILWLQTNRYIEVVYEDDFVANDGTVYPSPVKIITLFGWSAMRWEKFDYSRAAKFKELYEKHIAGQNIVTTKPLTSFVGKPDNARLPVRNKVTFPGQFKNLRSGPGTDYKDIGDIPYGSVIIVYEPTKIAPNSSKWRWVENTPAGDGWFCIDGIVFEAVPAIEPPTEEVPTVPAEPEQPPVETLPPPPVETFPPVDEQPPVYQTYGFQINVTLKAETEEAANAVVAYIIQTGAARLQQLKHDALVMKYLPLVEGSQFSIKVNL